MSVPAGAEAAAGVDTGSATENAAAAADNHTPATESVTPPPPAAATEGKDELKEIVTGLATSVATLANEVAGMKNPEARPHSLPWTHRGSRRHDH